MLPARRGPESSLATLREGPCTDAFASGGPVLEAGLGGVGMTRWPMYSNAAYEQGVRAVFAFPLQIGAVRLGVLDVHRRLPGSHPAQELSLALTFADVATTRLLDGQEQAPYGRPALGLVEAMDHRSEITRPRAW